MFLALAACLLANKAWAHPESPRLSWAKQLLVWSDSTLPGGKLEIWYPEAFCKTGAHGQSWDKTTWPHRTEVVATNSAGTEIKFRTRVRETVELMHTARLLPDGLEFEFEFTNRGDAIDLQWFQPACVRVAAFTGKGQADFVESSFIFAPEGKTLLAKTGRTEEALYRGGQVFIPEFTREADANPRPVAAARPVQGVIGCVSADGKRLLAIASDQTHELFEGVYVCLHSDPRLNGLAAGEAKRLRSRIYLLPNDPELLLSRYLKDFPRSAAGTPGRTPF
jgi:hypothetical protein